MFGLSKKTVWLKPISHGDQKTKNKLYCQQHKMIIKDTGGNFENAPTGTHIARCIGLIGVGTHESEYQGQKRLRTQIVVVWELPNESMSDGRPFVISQWYTRSLSEKANLRKDLKNWRGRDFTGPELQAFELRDILDKGCQVVLSENEKQKVNVTGVAGLPKGVTLPERQNDLRYFDIEEYNEGEFLALSDKMREKVRESLEFAELEQYGRVLDETERREVAEHGPGALDSFVEAPAKNDGEGDEIPF